MGEICQHEVNRRQLPLLVLLSRLGAVTVGLVGVPPLRGEAKSPEPSHHDWVAGGELSAPGPAVTSWAAAHGKVARAAGPRLRPSSEATTNTTKQSKQQKTPPATLSIRRKNGLRASPGPLRASQEQAP